MGHCRAGMSTFPSACEAGRTNKARGAASKMQTPGQRPNQPEPTTWATDTPGQNERIPLATNIGVVVVRPRSRALIM